MALLFECFILTIKEHHIPHIHIEFAEYKAVIEIPEGKLFVGNFPKDKMKLVCWPGLKFIKMN